MIIKFIYGLVTVISLLLIVGYSKLIKKKDKKKNKNNKDKK